MMKPADNRQPWSPEEHPPLVLLRAYQAGTLAPTQEHHLERHLLSCDLCADLAEGLALSSPAQTQSAVKDIHARLGKLLAKEEKKAPVWADWRAAAAILVLLCSLGLVIYQQSRQITADTSSIAFSQEKKVSPQPALSTSPESSTQTKEEIEVTESNFRPSAPPIVYQKKARKFSPPVQMPEVMEVADEKSLEVTEMAPSLETKPLTVFQDSAFANGAVAAKTRNETLALRLAGKQPMPVSSALAGSVAGVSVGAGKRTVKGKVVTAGGEGMPGVTVQVKGTSQAAATDINGEFQLSIPEGKPLLVASFIGYEPEEVVLAQNTQNLEIKLKEDNRSLSEVVVVGYGSQSKTSVQAQEVKTAARPEIGLKRYRKYLQENLRTPHLVDGKKMTGKVLVQFTVSASGQLQDLSVRKGLSPAHDAEALRLIKEGPTWKPGTLNGSKVPQKVKVSVRFK